MPTETGHFVIPKQRWFKPHASQIHSFINRLYDESWLPDPVRVSDSLPVTMTRITDNTSESESSLLSTETPRLATSKWLDDQLTADCDLRWNFRNVLEPFVGKQLGFAPTNNFHDGTLDLYSAHICWSQNYIQQNSDSCSSLGENAPCECGQNLAFFNEYPYLFASQIHYECPKCFEPFQLVPPSDDYLIYRFALYFYWDNTPDDALDNELAPDLVTLAADAFETEFQYLSAVF